MLISNGDIASFPPDLEQHEISFGSSSIDGSRHSFSRRETAEAEEAEEASKASGESSRYANRGA